MRILSRLRRRLILLLIVVVGILEPDASAQSNEQDRTALLPLANAYIDKRLEQFHEARKKKDPKLTGHAYFIFIQNYVLMSKSLRQDPQSMLGMQKNVPLSEIRGWRKLKDFIQHDNLGLTEADDESANFKAMSSSGIRAHQVQDGSDRHIFLGPPKWPSRALCDNVVKHWHEAGHTKQSDMMESFMFNFREYRRQKNSRQGYGESYKRDYFKQENGYRRKAEFVLTVVNPWFEENDAFDPEPPGFRIILTAAEVKTQASIIPIQKMTQQDPQPGCCSLDNTCTQVCIVLSVIGVVASIIAVVTYKNWWPLVSQWIWANGNDDTRSTINDASTTTSSIIPEWDVILIIIGVICLMVLVIGTGIWFKWYKSKTAPISSESSNANHNSKTVKKRKERKSSKRKRSKRRKSLRKRSARKSPQSKSSQSTSDSTGLKKNTPPVTKRKKSSKKSNPYKPI